MNDHFSTIVSTLTITDYLAIIITIFLFLFFVVFVIHEERDTIEDMIFALFRKRKYIKVVDNFYYYGDKIKLKKLNKLDCFYFKSLISKSKCSKSFEHLKEIIWSYVYWDYVERSKPIDNNFDLDVIEAIVSYAMCIDDDEFYIECIHYLDEKGLNIENLKFDYFLVCYDKSCIVELFKNKKDHLIKEITIDNV